MQKHVTLVGALHIGYSALQMLGGLIALLFILGGGLLGGLISEEKIVISIVFFIAGAIGTWLVLVSLPGIVAGVGVLRHWPWGRYMGNTRTSPGMRERMSRWRECRTRQIVRVSWTNMCAR